MSKTYVTGFPRIGEKRELKFALEAYWAHKTDFEAVKAVAQTLRERHWNYQQERHIDFISCNDFSLYDIMLDTTVMLGAIPPRFQGIEDKTERYFAMARCYGNDQVVQYQLPLHRSRTSCAYGVQS